MASGDSKSLSRCLHRHLHHRPELAACLTELFVIARTLHHSFSAGGRMYLAGNGGSAADCEHVAGELLKGFYSPRQLSARDQSRLPKALAMSLQGGLPAIPLTGFPALRSAVTNDQGANLDFAQLVWVLGRPGDCFLGFSTSGNSTNLLHAVSAAKARRMHTLAFTGRSGGALAGEVDQALRVPADATHLVQELHLSAYHALCLTLEEIFFRPGKYFPCRSRGLNLRRLP